MFQFEQIVDRVQPQQKMASSKEHASGVECTDTERETASRDQ